MRTRPSLSCFCFQNCLLRLDSWMTQSSDFCLAFYWLPEKLVADARTYSWRTAYGIQLHCSRQKRKNQFPKGEPCTAGAANQCIRDIRNLPECECSPCCAQWPNLKCQRNTAFCGKIVPNNFRPDANSYNATSTALWILPPC